MKSLIIGPEKSQEQTGSEFRSSVLKYIVSSFSDCDFLEANFLPDERVLEKLSRLWNCYKKNTNCKLPKQFEKKYDVVIIESLDFVDLAVFFGQSKVFFDAHNVGWEVLEFDLVNSPLIKKLPVGKRFFLHWLKWRGKRFEKKALKKMAGVLVCSEEDKKKFLAELPELRGKIFVLPNCLNGAEYVQNAGEKQSFVLYFGDFRYSANLDAARIIDEQIAPKLSEIEFRIIGKQAGALGLKSKNIVVLDYLPIEDLKKQISDAVMVIVPLRFGSGTRIKIIQAFAVGTPVISTKKGIEGIEAVNEKHFLLADKIQDFPEKILLLLKDKMLQKRLVKNARALLEEKYDCRVFEKSLKHFFEK